MLLFMRQSLNGVTKHGAWHIKMMNVKIMDEFLLIAFASFAQEPTYSLVDEVMWMLKQ